MLGFHQLNRLLLRFRMIPSYTHFSRTVREPSMEPILKPLSQMMLWLTIRIGKAFYHRMFLQHAHLIYASVMFSLDGREVPQMGMYLMMHANTVLPFHLRHTFWQMLDFQHVQVSLYLLPVHAIISRSGPEHQKGL